MKNILLAFLISLFLLAGSYLAYAYLFEGEKVNDIFTKEKNKETPLQEQREEEQRMAQGLKVGKYMVWSQRQENQDGSSIVSLWRYLLPAGKPEKFFTISLAEEETVRFDKFSDESLSIFVYKDGKIKERGQLVHLNGRVLGPAEQYPGRISPDRLWVVWWNSDDERLYLRDVIANKVTALKQGEFVLSGWSPDSRYFYWSGKEDKTGYIIWRYDTVDKKIDSFSTFQRLKQIKIYPQLAKALGSDLFSLWLIDLNSGKSQKLVESKDQTILDFYLSTNGNHFAYSLSEGGYWLESLSGQQLNKFVDIVKLYAWPDSDLLVGESEGGLSVFFIDENKRRLVLSRQDNFSNAWTYFNFIGIFDIR